MSTHGPVAFAVALFVLCASACDEKSPSGAAAASASAKVVTSAPPPTAAAPSDTKPVLSLVLDDKRFTANGDKVDFASTDPKGQLAGALSGKAGIDGAVVDVVIMRDALMPKVGMLLSALRAAKAHGVNVKTTRRDGGTSSLPLTWGDPRSECAAVGMIGKDGAITAWSVGGGTAARFARGFAGPDLTLGSAGVRKSIQACDAPVFYLAAADNIVWGLLFDLALSVRVGDEAGAPLHATTTTVLVEAPVPGRKVAQD